MQKKRQFLSLILSVMLVGQLGLAGMAMADETPSPDPSPVASESPAPSPSPSPSADPDPSPTPTPSESPEPSPSPSPSASPEPKPSYAKTGPNGCTGVIPAWVFDVANDAWVKADKDSFTCDQASHYYLSPKYVYDKRNGWYEIVPAASLAGSPDYFITAPNVVHTALGDLVIGSRDYEIAKAVGLLNSEGGILLSGSGPSSNNQASVTNNNQGYFDFTNLVNVINTLQSVATSGDATATSNTQVGNTTTGAAMVLANVINLLASAWSWSSGNLSFFMQNLLSHNGDIVLNPTQATNGGGGQLGGPGSANDASVSNNTELNVSAKDTGNIVNNVDILAQSGNASANGNTSAGNVASGNASAEVNIINLINSFIASGNSFFGILNIFGNLNGDILFPTGFLDGLLSGGSASVNGSGPDSTNQANVSNNLEANINNSSVQNVTNNVSTSAASGSAAASSNTQSGNVGSGNAQTTGSLFNLSNTSIFGDNAVLVMVNVLGHWVGKIMTLPGTGQSQAALLTGNAQVSGSGPASNNQASVSNNTAVNVNQQAVGTITNNVNVQAQSGDASATNNTSVGDVTSGNANAVSSVANIFNSTLNVRHWFGVLVINVFGDWFGSVNDDTIAGEAVRQAEGAAAGTPAPTSTPRVGLLALVTSPSAQASGAGAAGGTTGVNTVAGADGKVLTAAATTPAAVRDAAAQKTGGMNILFVLSAIVMLVAGIMASLDRKLVRR